MKHSKPTRTTEYSTSLTSRGRRIPVAPHAHPCDARRGGDHSDMDQFADGHSPGMKESEEELRHANDDLQQSFALFRQPRSAGTDPQNALQSPANSVARRYENVMDSDGQKFLGFLFSKEWPPIVSAHQRSAEKPIPGQATLREEITTRGCIGCSGSRHFASHRAIQGSATL